MKTLHSKTSKSNKYTLRGLGGFFLLFSILSFSQSFQWAKRGGSTDAMPTSSRREEVINIVTDSNKNIYILSAVGKSNLEVDGHPKTNFGDTNSIVDYMLASFACDGTYRWSKVFGGGGSETLQNVQIDAQDNVYVSGKFGSCGRLDNLWPPRIDNDVVYLQTPEDCSITFISKFNSEGVMQWFKRPQPAGASVASGFGDIDPMGLSVDSDGNCYWLVGIMPGTYCDGAFVNTITGLNFYILKYNSSGVFQNATLLNMQLEGSAGSKLKFYRNPTNGNYIFTGYRSSSSAIAIFGGQTVTHTVFMASLNAQGQFLWLRENTSVNWGSLSLHGLVFDAANNIYLSGRMLDINGESFLGFSVPTTVDFYECFFIMKVSPTADTLLWSANGNKSCSPFGGIALKGNEVACTGWGGGTNFTFSNQTLNVNPDGMGTKVILARFNKDTGSGLGLAKIDNNGISQNDYGTALAVDASGDYIVGGNFASQLIVNGNTLSNIGGQSDFFVAKYATVACSPLGVASHEKTPVAVYPNPTSGIVHLSLNEDRSYTLYTITGTEVNKGKVSAQNNTIDVSNLPSGVYMLQLQDGDGVVSLVKVLRE